MLLIILMSLEFEDGPVARKTKALYRKFYDGLNEVIREGQRMGEFRTDVPSRELVSIIVANHDGTFLERYAAMGYNDAAITSAAFGTYDVGFPHRRNMLRQSPFFQPGTLARREILVIKASQICDRLSKSAF